MSCIFIGPTYSGSDFVFFSLKVSTLQATSCSNIVKRHVAATNHFLCTGEFCENLCRCNRILSPQQVAQIQSDLIFCNLLQRQNSVAETKIFPKILQYTQSNLSQQRVASPCCCNQLPDLFTWSDLSPQCVAATCRLVCTNLYWLIDKFENMNTWSVDFWLTASEAICCISGSRHKVLNWNATILFSLICCKMALFSSSSFVNSSIPAGGFLREFVNDF